MGVFIVENTMRITVPGAALKKETAKMTNTL
jgi:hypothetical protein